MRAFLVLALALSVFLALCPGRAYAQGGKVKAIIHGGRVEYVKREPSGSAKGRTCKGCRIGRTFQDSRPLADGERVYYIPRGKR